MKKRNKIPPPPTHLSESAKQKWAEVVALLQERGESLDAGTLTAIACYSSAWAEWSEASLKVQELGLITKSPSGFPQENPYALVSRKAMTELRRWGEQLQLTPKTKRGKTAPAESESAVARILRTMDDTEAVA